jgi:NAD(P)-dependent dehydrogenase (short-subunit alcohol dehydrogenase family)
METVRRELKMGGRLQDKVAIVTGSGSVGPGWGNGKAMSVLFAREGASVVGVDIDAEAAAATQKIISDEGASGYHRGCRRDLRRRRCASGGDGARGLRADRHPGQ